jgi:hypothetical protein
MRVVLVLVVIVLVFALFGFIQFRSDSGKATVTLDTQKVEEATNEAVESGRELIHKASDSLRRE